MELIKFNIIYLLSLVILVEHACRPYSLILDIRRLQSSEEIVTRPAYR